MQSIIKKTGLGIAVLSAINAQGLQAEQGSLMAIFNEVFNQKFEEFKKIHNHNFSSITVKGNYLIDNEFPIGQNDKQQYFRCLAHDVKIGNTSLSFDVNDQRRRFTVIEGYSRNEDGRKRSYSKASARRPFPRNKSSDLRSKKRTRK